jgi:NitT/TauT family transport system ATP-binding protein
LDEIDLAIEPSQFVALIGPSGCGKSTLLNLLSGVIEGPTAGAISYDGRGVRGLNRDVGYMTQRDTLLPWRTLRQNLELPLRFRKESRAEIDARVTQAIAEVGLGGHEGSLPRQLSGGMRSRAMLARTTIYGPRTLLLDEPLGAVDALRRVNLQQILLSLWAQHRPTVLYVTHDIEEALLLADRIVVFSARPARVLDDFELSSARPRDPRRDPALATAFDRVWELLRSELERQQSAQDG